MINAKVNVEDMCHNCPDFKLDWNMETMYAGCYFERNVIISCENKDLCHHLKEYIEEVNKVNE